jgi:D-isomer specific 2-hydroxyacid dehydrogenase
MEVGYTSRSPKNVPWQRFPDMKALAQWCDFLIVVIPGSPETHHLVNAEVLDALGPQGYLVNIARGALVDTDALIKALKEHRIAGAALDVFEHEPHVEEGLIALDNVVLTPHQGSATVETRADMADLVMRNIRKALSGQAVITPVPGTRKD